MITSAEAKLGKNMALLGAILLVASIAINFLGSSDDSNPQLALISSLMDFVSNFSLIIIIMYSIKLFNLDEEPFIKAIGSISIIGVTLAMLTDLSPAFANVGFGPDGFTTEQISEISNTVTSGTWIVMPLFVLLVSIKYRGDMLPSWGGLGGIVAGSLMILMQAAALSGLVSDPMIFWPIWLVAGGIGFPLFAVGMSRAFASKI